MHLEQVIAGACIQGPSSEETLYPRMGAGRQGDSGQRPIGNLTTRPRIGFPFILGAECSSLSNQKYAMRSRKTAHDQLGKSRSYPRQRPMPMRSCRAESSRCRTAYLRGKTVILRQPRREIHVSGVSLDRMCEALVILQDLKTRDYPDWVNLSDISIGTGRKASLALIAACTTVAFREL